MARTNCVYCGAALSPEVLEEAKQAAARVLQSKSVTHLEAAARGEPRDSTRRYLVIDTAATPLEALAEACSISVWEARQWQASSRYRLLKVSTESPGGPLEASLKDRRLVFFALPEPMVSALRRPTMVESIDLSVEPIRCALRADPESAPTRRECPEDEVALIVSATIRREKVKEKTSLKAHPDTRLEDAFLVHLHLKNEEQPWEIDPRRTAYEGVSLASAHMNTRELVRRLSSRAPHDDAFKNVVPALSPGEDPATGLQVLKKSRGRDDQKQKPVVLDNVSQFREYSAWRGAVEKERLRGPRAE